MEILKGRHQGQELAVLRLSRSDLGLLILGSAEPEVRMPFRCMCEVSTGTIHNLKKPCDTVCELKLHTIEFKEDVSSSCEVKI